MLPLIPIDKANHFVYGAVVSAVAQVAAVVLGFPELKVYVGVGAAALVGAAKEGYDYIANKRGANPPHGVEFNDFLATALGGSYSLLNLL